jgi:transcriptional regulator with XRE-family HTH domain
MQQIEERLQSVPDRGVTKLALCIFDQIDAEMERQGLTQTELAERAGVNRAFVSRILNTPSNVTLGTVVRLANALGLEVAAPQLQPSSRAPELGDALEWWSVGTEASVAEGSGHEAATLQHAA